jgi:hypothetical protein
VVEGTRIGERWRDDGKPRQLSCCKSLGIRAANSHQSVDWLGGWVLTGCAAACTGTCVLHGCCQTLPAHGQSVLHCLTLPSKLPRYTHTPDQWAFTAAGHFHALPMGLPCQWAPLTHTGHPHGAAQWGLAATGQSHALSTGSHLLSSSCQWSHSYCPSGHSLVNS